MWILNEPLDSTLNNFRCVVYYECAYDKATNEFICAFNISFEDIVFLFHKSNSNIIYQIHFQYPNNETEILPFEKKNLVMLLLVFDNILKPTCKEISNYIHDESTYNIERVREMISYHTLIVDCLLFCIRLRYVQKLTRHILFRSYFWKLLQNINVYMSVFSALVGNIFISYSVFCIHICFKTHTCS